MNEQKPDWLEKLTEDQFLKSQLTVTEIDYKESVKYLVSHAENDTSGSRAAAQLLLSLYDGSKWHMDLSDFCIMDNCMVMQSLIAIRGRVILSKEPHSVIENGTEIFENLTRKWQHINVNNRYLNN